jgi:hypothetical protein
MRSIIETYFAPNQALRDLRDIVKKGGAVSIR